MTLAIRLLGLDDHVLAFPSAPLFCHHETHLLGHIGHDRVEVWWELIVGDASRELDEGLLLMQVSICDKEFVCERVIDLAKLLLPCAVLAHLHEVYEVVKLAALQAVCHDFGNRVEHHHLVVHSAKVVGQALNHLVAILNLLLCPIDPVLQLRHLPIVLVHSVCLCPVNPLRQLLNLLIKLLLVELEIVLVDADFAIEVTDLLRHLFHLPGQDLSICVQRDLILVKLAQVPRRGVDMLVQEQHLLLRLMLCVAPYVFELVLHAVEPSFPAF